MVLALERRFVISLFSHVNSPLILSKECLMNELGVDTITLMKALKSSVDPK